MAAIKVSARETSADIEAPSDSVFVTGDYSREVLSAHLRSIRGQ